MPDVMGLVLCISLIGLMELIICIFVKHLSPPWNI